VITSHAPSTATSVKHILGGRQFQQQRSRADRDDEAERGAERQRTSSAMGIAFGLIN
jgi:hypothetical protein